MGNCILILSKCVYGDKEQLQDNHIIELASKYPEFSPDILTTIDENNKQFNIIINDLESRIHDLENKLVDLDTRYHNKIEDIDNRILENNVKMNKIDDNFDKLSTNILDVKEELSVIIMKNTESTENVSNMINSITTKVNKIDDTMTTVFSTQWNLIDAEKENEIET